MAVLTITQVRSGIGGKDDQRQTLRTLGLKRIGQSVQREDTPAVLGMVRAVRHLVTVTGGASTSSSTSSTSSTEEVR